MTLPTALLTTTVYIPASCGLTFVSVNVLELAPDRLKPFLCH